jgi:hypothetical protein
VKSPFDSLIPIWYRSVLEFSAIYYLSKVIRLFRFACKMPFEIFGEGIFPVKKFFIDEIQQSLLLVNPRSLTHRSCKSVQWYGLQDPLRYLRPVLSLTYASQLKIHLKVTFRSPSTQLSAKNLHLLTKFGARKLIRLQFIASTNVTIQQTAIIANHGNVKYNANDMMFNKM